MLQQTWDKYLPRTQACLPHSRMPLALKHAPHPQPELLLLLAETLLAAQCQRCVKSCVSKILPKLADSAAAVTANQHLAYSMVHTVK